MITTFEQLWYILLIGSLGILGGIIRWSILKIMNTIESIREEQKIKDEKQNEMYARIEKALTELESSLKLSQQGCSMRHIPIQEDITDLKKRVSLHSKKLNEHDVQISILENNK